MTETWALIIALVVGVVLAVLNVWHRLGRTARARAWSESIGSEDHRSILVYYPLLALACVLAPLVALAPDGPVVTVAALLLLASLVTWALYFFLPLPVPRFVKPRWYQRLQEEATRGARG